LDILQKLGGILVVVFSIFAVCLPIAGFSVNLGYLSVFGIDNDLFPRSLVDLWQYSYLVSLKWLSFVIKPFLTLIYAYIAGMILLFLLGCVLVVLRTAGKLPLTGNRYEAMFSKVGKFIESCEMFYGETRGVWYMFLGLAVVLLSIYLLLSEPFQAGQEFARKDFDRYHESGCAELGWSRCADYGSPNNPDDESYSGLLVAASSSHIAIFDGSSVSVIPRKPEYVLVKTYTPKEKEKPEKAE
jgi:hypothetical protein